MIIALIRLHFYALPHCPTKAGILRRGATKEDVMKSFRFLVLGGALVIATPALANHIFHTDIPFSTRGACESEMAALSNNDDFLIDAFPDLFSSPGEVRSFLTRAFTCERDSSDGQWYITDHRQEVLESDWFARRNH